MNLFKSFFVKTIITLGDKLMGSKYVKTILEWNAFDKMSEKELDEIQKKGLKSIINHAFHTVPYYKEYFNNITTNVSIKDFPILTKELLREQKERLISNEFSENMLQKNYSSGSSGIQSFSFSEKKHKYFLQGIQSHWYLWSGYKIGNPVLQFGISPKRTFPKNIKDLLYNVHYLNSFSLDKQDHLHTIQTVKNKKIEYIIGYPSAINEFAKVMIEAGENHTIKGIISLGDKLFPHFKNNFNKAFNTPKIIDTYGCAEGLLMACSNDLEYYYIMSPHVYIEIVDDFGNEVNDGQLGHVLVTSLTNKAMPMIRYKLGDLAIKLPREKYPKDRKFNYPLLEKIVGRETDVILTPNGKTLIVHSFTGIVEYYPEIKQYKITQNELDSILFEYITDENFNFTEASLLSIQKEIDLLTAGTLEIKFEKVASIKASPSGKPQIIESSLKKINSYTS